VQGEDRLSDRLVWSFKDDSFLSTPGDVIKHMGKLRLKLKAAAMLLQKKVQMRVPIDEGLETKNIVVAMKKNSANVEVVPIRPRKKQKPVFNSWVNDIEYKKKPFLRVAFDETVEEIVDLFYMELGDL
jgi:hypothetical protein